MLSTALSVPAIFGYGGNRAYAACVNSGGSTYLCSGVETVTQTIAANNASVTMAPGASVDTSAGAGSAIVISGDGALSFTNLDGGSIVGASRGLDIQAGNGLPAASIYVQSTQDLIGRTGGIYALNAGVGVTTINAAGASSELASGVTARVTNAANTGDLSVTATGTVSGGNTALFAAHYGTGAVVINSAAVDATAGGNGVFARSYGTGLSVIASGTVAGASNGVYTVHHGSSDTNINVVDVTGSTQSAVNARQRATVLGGDLNITSTGALTGHLTGIYATHSGTGAININAAAVTGTIATGIVAFSTNAANTSDISVTTTGTVSGENGGLFAANYGTGAVTINAAAVNGGAGNTGIFARSYGTGLSVTASGAVAGVTAGVYTVHHGSSDTTINVADVSSSAGSAVNARQRATVLGGDLNITSTGTLTGNQNGVYALHSGTGAITINAAAVTGTIATGIVARSTNAANMSDISVTTTGAVSGATDGISVSHDGGGAVTINTSGAVSSGHWGIYARNDGTGGAEIAVSGAVAAQDTGIRVYAHGSNQINIANGGSVTGNGHAIFTGGTTDRNSDDIVTNAGLVSGLVDLGGGTNAFNNSAGGVFQTLGTVMVGAGNVLTNGGTVSPGGAGTIQTTALTGNFVQTAGGIFAVDVDGGAASADRLNVSGTASLAGRVALDFTNLVTTQGVVTILSAAGGTTNNGVTTTGAPVVVDATLSYPNATDVVLTYAVDFTPASLAAGLTPNQATIGAGVNALFGAGAGGTIATGLLGITELEAYKMALDRLQGEAFLDQVGKLFGSNHLFIQNLLSCPSRLDGAEVQVAGEECIWGRVEGRAVDTERTSSNVGGRETVWGFSGGFEAPIEENVRVGFSLALETSDAETNSGTFSDGTRVTAGAKIEKSFGAWETSLGVFGGLAFYDTTRLIGIAGVGPALSDHEVGSLSSVARLSYSHEMGGVRIVPMLDLTATYVSFGGINETGAGAANLIVADSDEWIYSATPAIGALGTLVATEDYKVNVSARAGVSLFSKSGFSSTARFAGAPAGTAGFTTTSGFDDVVGNFAAAVEWQASDNASIKVGYDGRVGDTFQSHGGFVRAVLPF